MIDPSVWRDAASDTTCLLRAIDRLPQQGGKICLPAGRPWIIDQWISIDRPYVLIEGEGPGTVIVAKPGARLAGMVLVNGFGFTMRDLAIDGAVARDPNESGTAVTEASAGIYLLGKQATLERVRIHDVANNGIVIATNAPVETARPEGILIRDCRLYDNGNWDPDPTAPGHAPVGGNGILAVSNAGQGWQPRFVAIEGCTFERNCSRGNPKGLGGAMGLDVTYARIHGNFAKNNYNIGAQVADVGWGGTYRYWTVTDNIVVSEGERPYEVGVSSSTSGFEASGCLISLGHNVFKSDQAGNISAAIVMEAVALGAGSANAQGWSGIGNINEGHSVGLMSMVASGHGQVAVLTAVGNISENARIAGIQLDESIVASSLVANISNYGCGKPIDDRSMRAVGVGNRP